MKLTIFGASGKTGQQVVQQALEGGYQVVALARTPSKLAYQHANLQIIQGDNLDPVSVANAVQGSDAVISVLGPGSNKPEFTISRGMENILSAMEQYRVPRIIIVTGAGVRVPADSPRLVDHLLGLLLHLFSRNVLADMEQVARKVRASDLAWTIVRVPMLTDEPASGHVKIGYVGDINPRIARADLATFLLKQVEDQRYLRQSPAISN